MKSGSRLLILAPTGYGKTLPALVGVKAFIEKTSVKPVFWLVRSLTLGRRIREDAELVELKVFTAGGREKCCNLFISGVEIDPHQYCRYFRYKCDYYINLEEIKNVWDVAESYRDLIELLPHTCAYFTQERILSKYDVCVQNYFRRRFIGYTTIIDECHNLLVPREKRIEIEKLAEAIALLETTTINSKTINSLDSLAHRIAEVPDESTIYPRNFIGEEELEELQQLYIELLYKRKLPESVRKLIEAVNFKVLYKEGGQVTGYKPPYIPRYNVALSASVPESLVDFLKADKIVKVRWNKLKAYIVDGVTTKYGLETFNEYRTLLNFARRKFRKVLAIAPSRRVKKQLPSDYEESLHSVEMWRKRGGLLTITARGRFSEGLDLDADVVVVTGCPFLPPEVGNVLRRSYRRLGLDEKLAVKAPMLISTIQAIGRAYRGRGSKPLVVLADERYRRYTIDLEDFFKLEITTLEGLSKIIKSKQ